MGTQTLVSHTFKLVRMDLTIHGSPPFSNGWKVGSWHSTAAAYPGFPKPEKGSQPIIQIFLKMKKIGPRGARPKFVYVAIFRDGSPILLRGYQHTILLNLVREIKINAVNFGAGPNDSRFKKLFKDQCHHPFFCAGKKFNNRWQGKQMHFNNRGRCMFGQARRFTSLEAELRKAGCNHGRLSQVFLLWEEFYLLHIHVLPCFAGHYSPLEHCEME